MFGVQAAPPGFIMTAKVLLDNNNAPTREEVRDWFQKNRNLCRCTGYKPDVYCLEEMYKKARPLYEAGKKQVAEKTAASDRRYKYGIGVASGVYGCGLDGVDASQAYAELNPDGTVTMYTSWEDHGQGADMGTLVSAHETLRQAGIKPEQIRLVMNAIYNATGARITRIPALPEVVLAALKDLEK